MRVGLGTIQMLYNRIDSPREISRYISLYVVSLGGEFTEKNANLYLQILSWHFFVVFLSKTIVLLSFSFIFIGEVSNFGNRILTI